MELASIRRVERTEAKARQRLAEALRARRQALDLTQRDVTAAGGPALSTLRQIEAAKSPGGLSRTTTLGLDRALRWVPGSAAALLAGQSQPQALDTEGWPTPSGDWAAYVDRRADESDASRGEDLERAPHAVDDRDGQTPLAGYSDAQLVAELARRLAKRQGERARDE